MRIAREMGDVSSLFPEGITRLDDLPHTLFMALKMALIYLGFEELPKDESPPRRIWQDAEKLGEWFVEVERMRKSRYGGEDGAEPIADKAIEGEETRNPAALGLIVD